MWCFGDSAGMNFNFNPPHTFTSQCKTRGSATSVADTAGNLILYTAETPWGTYPRRTRVFNSQGNIIQNGDSIIGLGWYNEHVLLPAPGFENLFYLFSVGVTNDYGLYYSIIDMNLNGGMGGVVQKNIQLLSYEMEDGVQAIKHGNGRDWWIFCHRWDISNNDYYRYLLTPNGIQGPFIQSIGDSSAGSGLSFSFSKSGRKAAVVNYGALFELFNFDRCTGLFSINPLYTFSNTSITYNDFWSCEFSPNENVLYISQPQYSVSYLLQLDLTDSVPWNTRDTLWSQPNIRYCGGALELAPDERIYYATTWYDGVNFPYPYPDTAYYLENMNLGVINYPDSFGATCDFQPYGFNLGGNRTYSGLPNNPDYNLEPDQGALCDSLSVGITPITISKRGLKIFYHSDWQTAFINAEGLKGENYSLNIFNIEGKSIFNEQGKLSAQYFIKDLPCNFASGSYIVSLATEKEILSSKFIIP